MTLQPRSPPESICHTAPPSRPHPTAGCSQSPATRRCAVVAPAPALAFTPSARDAESRRGRLSHKQWCLCCAGGASAATRPPRCRRAHDRTCARARARAPRCPRTADACARRVLQPVDEARGRDDAQSTSSGAARRIASARSVVGEKLVVELAPRRALAKRCAGHKRALRVSGRRARGTGMCVQRESRRVSSQSSIRSRCLTRLNHLRIEDVRRDEM